MYCATPGELSYHGSPSSRSHFDPTYCKCMYTEYQGPPKITPKALVSSHLLGEPSSLQLLLLNYWLITLGAELRTLQTSTRPWRVPYLVYQHRENSAATDTAL